MCCGRYFLVDRGDIVTLQSKCIKVSEVRPEELKKMLISEVGDRAQDKLYNFLQDLSLSYPDFNSWFFDKVIPEMERDANKREIIIVMSKMGEGELRISGIAILKKDESEQKICTFRVHEDYRRHGIGTLLLEQCIAFLGTSAPIITVSSDRVKMFAPLLAKYNFKEMQRLDNYYVEGSTEYVYNGKLESR